MPLAIVVISKQWPGKSTWHNPGAFSGPAGVASPGVSATADIAAVAPLSATSRSAGYYRCLPRRGCPLRVGRYDSTDARDTSQHRGPTLQLVSRFCLTRRQMYCRRTPNNFAASPVVSHSFSGVLSMTMPRF
jgi:hypothetical protein